MARVLLWRTDTASEKSADRVVAATGRTLLAFVAWPFSIVMAMRPQREREAARIAREFRADSTIEAGHAFNSSVAAECSAFPAVRERRAANIGYVLFAAGIISITVIAVGAAGRKSEPDCKYIPVGDMSVCSEVVTAAPKKLPVGLVVLQVLPFPSASARYAGHMHWLDRWSTAARSELPAAEQRRSLLC
jgi:hypothetical protein